MKAWAISKTEVTDKYFIATEKAIWLTEQPKEADISKLIEDKALGTVRSIRYQELKEIIFIDSHFTIEINFKDDKATDEELQIEKSIYSEIRAYLKEHLKGTELKNYSIFKQILPQLFFLGIAALFSVATYLSAMELESGDTVRTAGKRAWLKKIIVLIAEQLGTSGTLIVGILIIGALAYFLIKKIRNPKTGEVLKMATSPQLVP